MKAVESVRKTVSCAQAVWVEQEAALRVFPDFLTESSCSLENPAATRKPTLELPAFFPHASAVHPWRCSEDQPRRRSGCECKGVGLTRGKHHAGGGSLSQRSRPAAQQVSHRNTRRLVNIPRERIRFKSATIGGSSGYGELYQHP